MHYVIGDVHGCYDEMIKLVEKIEAQDSNAVIYFVGDFVDRGPRVWEVLSWAMEHITPDGKYRSVRGNHEELVLEWYERWNWWYKEIRGTEKEQEWKEPKTKYDFYERLAERNMLEPEQIEPVVSFFRSLPYNRAVTVTNTEGKQVNYRIVHAWHYQYKNISRKDQIYANLWERNLIGNENSGEVIVHGHTPTLPDGFWRLPEEVAGKVYFEERSNSINVDGGCCFKRYAPNAPCMLCGICLETQEEFYPCTLEERFEEFKAAGYLSHDCEREELPAFWQQTERGKPEPYHWILEDEPEE